MKRNLKSDQFLVLALSSLGFLLESCTGGGVPTSSSENSPVASSPTTNATARSPVAQTKTQTGSSHDRSVSQGGQVIESGPYHLELVTLKETSGIHLDFYLQKGDTHQAIPNATVTGQVQLPDGSQKSVNFKYNATDRHYTAILPGTPSGNYQIAVLTDINGEKVNGRFNFSQ